MSDPISHLTPEIVRRRIHAGALVREIAADFGLSVGRVSTYMDHHGISVLCEDNALPAPDLSHQDKVVVYRARIDQVSGARRIIRISLARNTMHVRQLEALG